MKRILAAALISIVVGISWPACADEPAPPLERVGEEAFHALSQVFDYDRDIPLEAHTVERDRSDDGPRERIVFRGVQGFFAPGYLQLPAAGKAPYPCVLLLHGWSGSKAHWWQNGGYISGGNVRRGLLSAGFAVLALDAQCHGDRIAENDYALVNEFRPEQGEPRKRRFSQRDIYIQTVRDYRRAIDYLASRSDIDSQRIGMLGYSMGGTQTFLLTALEPRIKAAVACATPADHVKISPLAPQNYVRGIGKRPFLMVVGEHDPMCSQADARQLFELIDSPAAELRFFPGEHKITSAYVAPAVEWLAKQL